MRYVGLVLGLGLVGAGIYLLVTGLRQILDFPIGNCFGADCFDLGAAFLTLPAAIFALVIGGIVLTFSITAIRSRNPAALGGISGLSALGALFVVMGAAFVVVTSTTSSIVGGTFIFLAATFILIGLAILAVDQWLAARRRRAHRLRSAGMRGNATILSVADSNVTINNDPMVNMRLRVNIANHPAYEVSKRQVISRIAVGRYVPGAVLPVLVDPADPTDVMIDERGAVAAGDPTAALGTRSRESVVRLGDAEDVVDTGPFPAVAAAGLSAALSPDLMATIGDALQRAADQFSSGQLGSLGNTTITVDGRTFQVPGGGGRTIVIEPDGRVVTTGPADDPGTEASGTTGAASPGFAVTASGAAPSGAPSSGATSATGPANGRVSIETLTDTGTELGDMHLYSFELTVSPAGGRPYTVAHAALVPAAQVPRLIRGASFPAIIDANLPGGLGIFWDR